MLTDLKVKAAKPQEKPYKLTDGHGLRLYVPPTGSKYWRYRYEIAGREKVLSLGEYPDMSLGDAREARDKARKMLKAGRDPAREKRQIVAKATADAENTFEKVTREWHKLQKPNGLKSMLRMSWIAW